MTRNKRARLGWASALLMVTSTLVVAGGLDAADADDATPSPTPSPTATATATASASPSDPAPTDDASATPTSEPSPAPVEVEQPAAPTPSGVPAPTPEVADGVDGAAGVGGATRRPRSGPCVAGTYAPPPGELFNYPYGGKTARNTIRRHVRQTILATPAGGSIHISAFSINDNRTVNALIGAVRRGVTVQVVVNHHNVTGNLLHAPSPSFRRLRRALTSQIYRPGIPEEQVSFAKICHKSCRGTGGNVHEKMFLLWLR